MVQKAPLGTLVRSLAEGSTHRTGSHASPATTSLQSNTKREDKLLLLDAAFGVLVLWELSSCLSWLEYQSGATPYFQVPTNEHETRQFAGLRLELAMTGGFTTWQTLIKRLGAYERI